MTFAMQLLAKKLSKWVALSTEDLAVLDSLYATRRRLRRHDLILQGGRKPSEVFLVVDGWAARQKTGREGGRQIVGLMLPGDFSDIHATAVDRMDHDIVMLSNGSVATISRDQMLTALKTSPALSHALQLQAFVDQAILRQWLFNIGQRDAGARLAHLLCEISSRTEPTSDGSIPFPASQEELGDLLGLTGVHINRTLKWLSGEGIIAISGRALQIIDFDRLKRIGSFDPAYLFQSEMGPAAQDARAGGNLHSVKRGDVGCESPSSTFGRDGY